jgi:TRAP transporter TAXI family solute receptor
MFGSDFKEPTHNRKKEAMMMNSRNKKMGKALAGGFAVVLVGVFLFTGTVSAAKVRQMTMGTAGSKGYWYMMGSIIAKIISAEVPNVRLTAVVSPGTSTENAKRIHAREMELGFSTSLTSYLAYNGLDVFKPVKRDILSWFFIARQCFMGVVRADSDIKTIYDLKGKKISIDKKGTTGYSQTMELFELHGLTKGSYKEYNQSRGEGSRALIDGRVDAWFYSTALNLNPHVTRVMAARKVRFLSMDKTKMKPFLAKHPYYTLVDHDVVRGVKGDTPISMVQYVAHTTAAKHMDEKFVYDCTKAVFDNIGQIHAASPKYKVVNLQNALLGLNIPVHPGAMKYYKEKGIKRCNDPALQYKP